MQSGALALEELEGFSERLSREAIAEMNGRSALVSRSRNDPVDGPGAGAKERGRHAQFRRAHGGDCRARRIGDCCPRTREIDNPYTSGQ